MEKLTSIESGQLHCIERDFFNSRVVKVGDNEGYKYEGGVACFGLKIGPRYSVSDGLLHEMGHLAEVQKLDRLKMYGFGLEVKTKVHFLGKVYFEPRTWDSTKLELRVILWQEVLAERFDIEFNRNVFCKVLQYMPDFWNVPLLGYKWDVEKEGYYDQLGIKCVVDLKKRDDLRFASMWSYMDSEKETGRYTYINFVRYWRGGIDYLLRQS
jgi:hypothetical protein